MSLPLAQQKCVPCHGGLPPLTADETAALHPQAPDWAVVERNGIPRLERVFRFKTFAQALAFTNRVGALAEEQDHHPVLVTEWGKVTVTWWTHAIGGLSENDFICAAKVDRLVDGAPGQA